MKNIHHSLNYLQNSTEHLIFFIIWDQMVMQLKYLVQIRIKIRIKMTETMAMVKWKVILILNKIIMGKKQNNTWKMNKR